VQSFTSWWHDMMTPGRCYGIKMLIKEYVCLLGALVIIMHGWGVSVTFLAYTTPYLPPYFPHVLTLIEGLLPRKDAVQRAATVGTHTLSFSTPFGFKSIMLFRWLWKGRSAMRPACCGVKLKADYWCWLIKWSMDDHNDCYYESNF